MTAISKAVDILPKLLYHREPLNSGYGCRHCGLDIRPYKPDITCRKGIINFAVVMGCLLCISGHLEPLRVLLVCCKQSVNVAPLSPCGAVAFLYMEMGSVVNMVGTLKDDCSKSCYW